MDEFNFTFSFFKCRFILHKIQNDQDITIDFFDKCSSRKEREGKYIAKNRKERQNLFCGSLRNLLRPLREPAFYAFKYELPKMSVSQ